MAKKKHKKKQKQLRERRKKIWGFVCSFLMGLASDILIDLIKAGINYFF